MFYPVQPSIIPKMAQANCGSSGMCNIGYTKVGCLPAAVQRIMGSYFQMRSFSWKYPGGAMTFDPTAST
jgi:hypothetical protein